MPFLVPPLLNDRSGVDYLNLRQVNLDLMAELAPGVNNTTRFVRPYSVMCWVHWKFTEQMKAAGRTSILPSEFTVFKEKVESLLTWGHQLHGLRGLPGMDAKVPQKTSKGVPLDFKSWKRQASNTSLQAPVQYGPSLSDLGGLGFLVKTGRNSHKVSSAGRRLAEALDIRLRKSPNYGVLEDLKETHGTEAQAMELWKHWRADGASSEERAVFREALFDPHAVDDDTPIGRRSAFISLVRKAVSESHRPATAEQVRQAMMLQGWSTTRPFRLRPGEDRCARLWMLLQLRQMQRLSLETWLGWIEFQMLECGVLLPDELVAKASQAALAGFQEEIGKRPGNGAEALKLIDVDADSLQSYATQCQAEPEWVEPGTLMKELVEADWEDVPFLCFYHLLFLWKMRPLLEADDLLKGRLAAGGSARISLTRWMTIVDGCLNRPVKDLCDEIVKTLLISQHLYTATQRYDGQKLRHRFVLEQEGLDPLIKKPSTAAPTPDRLAALMELMFHAGLIDKLDERYAALDEES